ncbi:hypothetical protein [Schumannella sp. 10F1B-5-1]|uniref:hypothetical protein n=1 Tax=Schumannella sp. 10F1B-5-1 TaxID=2590780 RepID=UPI0015E87435|nr:hypothetical protein [Schumannella sp. 10F1B-5-1]
MGSRSEAEQALANAMVNANNTITYGQRVEARDKDLGLAVQSIGYALHALARAQQEQL